MKKYIKLSLTQSGIGFIVTILLVVIIFAGLATFLFVNIRNQDKQIEETKKSSIYAPNSESDICETGDRVYCHDVVEDSVIDNIKNDDLP